MPRDGGPRHGWVLALVDADAARRGRLATLLGVLGHRVAAHAAVPQIGRAEAGPVDAVLHVATADAPPVAALRIAFPRARIVVASTDASQRAAVAAFRAGADDFVGLAAGDGELAAAFPPRPTQPAAPDCDLVGDSAAIVALRQLLPRLAASSATVLVSGETGSGKERAALALHRLSPRAGAPLVALNCAAIPDALLEGELFGYERGAFSGAVTAFPGKLKLADHGTLLLDEIGELSPAGQAKVLRALETGEVYRLGARAPTRFDVRIVAATNRDLEAEVRAGRFRADLYYRIAVGRVHLPPLRERREDLAAIAALLLADLPGRASVAPDALAALLRHDWPGNLRELRNVLEVALVHGDGRVVRAADLPGALSRAAPPDPERARLAAALAAARGNKSLAAQALNCSRMTLYRRLARAGLAAPVTVSHEVSREAVPKL
jgi:DNA-binding NtrC family response regulator